MTTQEILLLFWRERYDGNLKCSQAVRNLHIIQQDECQKLWSSLCHPLGAQGCPTHRKVSGTGVQMGARSNQEPGNFTVMRQVHAQARKSICWPGLGAVARQGHSDRVGRGSGLAAPMAGHTVGTWRLALPQHPCVGVWWPRGLHGVLGHEQGGGPSGQAGPLSALSVLVAPCSGTDSRWLIRIDHVYWMCYDCFSKLNFPWMSPISVSSDFTLNLAHQTGNSNLKGCKCNSLALRRTITENTTLPLKACLNWSITLELRMGFISLAKYPANNKYH